MLSADCFLNVNQYKFFIVAGGDCVVGGEEKWVDKFRGLHISSSFTSLCR